MRKGILLEYVLIEGLILFWMWCEGQFDPPPRYIRTIRNRG